MAMLKKIIIGLIGLIVVLLGVGFLLPSHFKVERSMVGKDFDAWLKNLKVLAEK